MQNLGPSHPASQPVPSSASRPPQQFDTQGQLIPQNLSKHLALAELSDEEFDAFLLAQSNARDLDTESVDIDAQYHQSLLDQAAQRAKQYGRGEVVQSY